MLRSMGRRVSAGKVRAGGGSPNQCSSEPPQCSMVDCRMPPEAQVISTPTVAGAMTHAVADILDQSMCPEANESDTELPPPIAQNQQPGMFAGIGSIVAGMIGFSLPVVGMAASCIGIWLGIKGIRQGRAAKYRPSIICGIVGISVDGLGIVFWVCAVLFESYH